VEKRRRLGRGLEEISHYFISSRPERDIVHPSSVGRRYRCRVVSIVDLFDPYRGAILTSRLGLDLCKRDIKTFLIDADRRFPGIAFMLGLSFPGYSFKHYLPSDMVYNDPSGIKILAPRLSLTDISRRDISDLLHAFEYLTTIERETDIILLKQYEDMIRLYVEEAIYLVSPLPVNIVRVYREIKSFVAGLEWKGIGIVITDVINETAAFKAFERIGGCLERYCGVKPRFFGHLPDTSISTLSSIVSNISGTILNEQKDSWEGRSFFERLRYLMVGNSLTSDEMASLLD